MIREAQRLVHCSERSTISAIGTLSGGTPELAPTYGYKATYSKICAIVVFKFVVKESRIGRECTQHLLKSPLIAVKCSRIADYDREVGEYVIARKGINENGNIRGATPHESAKNF